MLEFNNGAKLCQTWAEMPKDLVGASTVYVDFETTSRSPLKTSLNPWMDCWIHGIGICVDDRPEAWFIPYDGSIDKCAVLSWLLDILRAAKVWCNHNVKYDALVLHNEVNHTEWLTDSIELQDTVTLAKLADSDRLRYSLEVLSLEWLGEDVSGLKDALSPYVGASQKDYGKIPMDILAEYGGQDVLTVRKLSKHIDGMLSDGQRGVMRTEIELTKNLLKMECIGLSVDREELEIEELQTLAGLFAAKDSLLKATGTMFRPNVNADCYEVLCGGFGLPVLGWTKGGKNNKPKPSFDKYVLMDYLHFPGAPVGIIKSIATYRQLYTHYSMFVTPYQELATDSTLHSSYNQIVRTGRMSSSTPNAQQLNKKAKRLIHPHKGKKFISFDFKSVEYRILVQYLQNPKAIKAYEDDPDTDYHMLVAGMCGISRRPAKTMNFLMAFGGGKALALTKLSADEEFVAAAEDLAKGDSRVFKDTLATKALEAYAAYHRNLPELKRFSREAEYRTKVDGFTTNHYGRRRHLPPSRAFTSLNTLVQSSAADLAKDRMNALCRHLQDQPDVNLVAMVHDEFLVEAPIDFKHTSDIVEVLEDPDKVWDVPIRVSVSESSLNWGEC